MSGSIEVPARGRCEGAECLLDIDTDSFVLLLLRSFGVRAREGEELVGVTIVVNTTVDDADERVLFLGSGERMMQFRQSLSYLHQHYDNFARSQ